METSVNLDFCSHSTPHGPDLAERLKHERFSKCRRASENTNCFHFIYSLLMNDLVSSSPPLSELDPPPHFVLDIEPQASGRSHLHPIIPIVPPLLDGAPDERDMNTLDERLCLMHHFHASYLENDCP
jgi:hypothetical protein